MSDASLVISLATLGAVAQLSGVILVVREIAGDRRRARELIDKQRHWKPENRPPPMQVSAWQVKAQSGLSPYRAGSHDPIAGQIASLVTGHNRSVREVETLIDSRTQQLLEQIDSGDKELRNVLPTCSAEAQSSGLVGWLRSWSGSSCR